MQNLSTLFDKRITLICGAFGSGKTELSVNLALSLAESHPRVALVDLDIVNLYFRSRQLREFFAQRGIETIDSTIKGDLIDLPALSPAIQGAFQRPDLKVVVDVGGDDVGARVLGRYDLISRDRELVLVVNTYRPFSDSPEKIVSIIEDIQKKARIPVDSIIVNSNLGDETGPEHLRRGLEMVKSAGVDIPIRGALFWENSEDDPEEVAERRDEFMTIGEEAGVPVFPIGRYMRPFSV